MLPWPSIWPPPRKKASTRPWAAQSNSSILPLVKKLFACDPSIDMRTGGLPLRALRARSSIAPAAGIGDDAPTATWPTPRSRSATATIRRSRSLGGFTDPFSPLGGASRAPQIGVEALLRPRGCRIARDLGRIRRVLAPQAVGPGAVRRVGDGADVERRQHASGRDLVVEERGLADAFHGDERLARRVGHEGELAAPADPDVALAVGFRGMEQAEIRPDRRDDRDRIGGVERVVDDAPV